MVHVSWQMGMRRVRVHGAPANVLLLGVVGFESFEGFGEVLGVLGRAHLVQLICGELNVVPKEVLPPPLLYLFLLKVLPERLQLRLCGVASAALGGLVPFCDAVLGHVPHCHAEAGGDVEEECSPDCCADNHVDPGPPVDGAWVPATARRSTRWRVDSFWML